MSTGKHLVFSTDPESVKDEFAFDNPGFRQEEKNWQHEAPTLPLGGKNHALHAEFTKPEQSKDDSYLQVCKIQINIRPHFSIFSAVPDSDRYCLTRGYICQPTVKQRSRLSSGFSPTRRKKYTILISF